MVALLSTKQGPGVQWRWSNVSYTVLAAGVSHALPVVRNIIGPGAITMAKLLRQCAVRRIAGRAIMQVATGSGGVLYLDQYKAELCPRRPGSQAMKTPILRTIQVTVALLIVTFVTLATLLLLGFIVQGSAIRIGLNIMAIAAICVVAGIALTALFGLGSDSDDQR
jgi:hypothetical protein